MHNAARFNVLPLLLLLSGGCFAGEPVADIESLINESPYPPHLQLYRSPMTGVFRNDLQSALTGIEFQDNSALGRLSQLRNLALITFAESPQSSLFLGVNENGLLGLHWMGSGNRGGKRIYAVARMPYLKYLTD